VLFVVNTRRPFQGSAAQLADSLAKIERSARLKADGIVLNANLGAETTGEELAEGYAIVRELEKETGLPMRYVSGTEDSLRVFAQQCQDCTAEKLTLTIRMRPDWLESNRS
jgi:hypothetical protein